MSAYPTFVDNNDAGRNENQQTSTQYNVRERYVHSLVDLLVIFLLHCVHFHFPNVTLNTRYIENLRGEDNSSIRDETADFTYPLCVPFLVWRYHCTTVFG